MLLLPPVADDIAEEGLRLLSSYPDPAEPTYQTPARSRAQTALPRLIFGEESAAAAVAQQCRETLEYTDFELFQVKMSL